MPEKPTSAAPNSGEPESPLLARHFVEVAVCAVCDGSIGTQKYTESSNAQLVGWVVALVGLALCFTIIGAIVGIPLILGGLLLPDRPQTRVRHVCAGCGASPPVVKMVQRLAPVPPAPSPAANPN